MEYINAGEPWTDAEKRFLIENYKTLGPTVISQKLGRSVRATTNYASAMRRKRVIPFGPTSSGRPRLDIQ